MSERIHDLERQLEDTKRELRAQQKYTDGLENRVRKLESIRDFVEGVSVPVRWTLRLTAAALGAGALHWIVEFLRWWMNPMRVTH